ncbi:MAG: PD-(D/E)XK nuclease family protein, partial [Clostridia bacterium]|nr:PD-(D/E)XK nuclease family protein [Clostridia bacterium]
MLHLVYGTKNSQKSDYIAQKITDCLRQGERVILLVPERRSVAVEKAMLSAVPDECKLGLEVLSFRRLCNRVFREYGGLYHNYIGTGGKLLVLWRVLRELSPSLKVYGDLDLGNKKVIVTLLDTLTALDRAALSNQTLNRLAKAADECGNRVLFHKLEDLILIREGYRAVLHKDFHDPEEDLDRLCTLLDTHSFFEGYTVFIDETASFSGRELAVLRRILAQSPLVTATVGRCLEDQRTIFRKLHWYERALREAAKDMDCPVTVHTVPEDTSGPSAALLALRTELFSNEPSQEPSADGVTLMRCESKAEEADMIAVSILDSVGNGRRWRDHAVVLRDPEQYRGILDRRLRAAGIPFYFAQSRPLSDQPAVKSLLSAMTLVANRYRAGDMDAYLKAGFTPLDFSQICRLSDYASIWQIEGSGWRSDTEWCMNPKGRSLEINPDAPAQLAELNRLKRLVMLPLEELAADQKGELTVRERALLLWRFYEKNGYPERILEQAHRKNDAGDSAGALRLCQTGDLFCDCLDELTEAAGDLPCTLSLFAEMLSAVIDEKTVGSIPQKNDEVLITDVFSSGSQRFAHLYIPGLCDGCFPSSAGGGGLFADAELRFFEQNGVDLPGIEEHRATDEFFAFEEAVAAAKEQLTLSYPTKDSAANGTSPSPFLASVKEVLPSLVCQSYGDLPLAKRLGSLPMLVSLYHSGGTGVYEKLFASLLADTVKTAPYGGGIDADFALSLYGDNMLLSQSKLEKFISCPFAYTCTYLFRLKEDVAPDTAANEYGTLMHAVFEEVLRDLSAKGDPAEAEDGTITALIDEKIGAFKKNMIGDGDDPRTRQLLRRAGVTAFLLLSGMRDEFKHSLFRPAFFELPFGMNGEEGALTLPALQFLQEDGLKAGLRGVADRVDLYQKDNTVYFRIVDYKTGNKEFDSAELEKGLSGQMLLYMRAVCSCRDKAFLERIGADENTLLRPAGIVYCIAKRPSFISDPGMTTEEILAGARGRIERHGVAINEDNLLLAQDTTGTGCYLPTGKGKRMSEEDFV